MSRQDLFEGILASFNQAMLDDALWPVAAGLIDEFCGAKGNFLVFGDGATQDDIDIFFARFCFRGQRREDLERLYFEVYHAVDERLPRFRLLPDSRLVPALSLFTEEELKTSVVYNEALPLADCRNSLNVRLDGPEGSRIGWAIADPVEGDGWSPASSTRSWRRTRIRTCRASSATRRTGSSSGCGTSTGSPAAIPS